MVNIASRYWNEIAQRAKKLSTPWGRDYFHLDNMEIAEAMDKEVARLEKQGLDSKVVSGFLLVAPLVAEADAIREYARKNPVIRRILPEVTSLEEAVILASKEYRLTPQQQRDLLALLQSDQMVQGTKMIR